MKISENSAAPALASQESTPRRSYPDSLSVPGYEIEIIDARANAVKNARVRPQKPGSDPDQDSSRDAA